jgi:ankyrin repeat protein
MLLPVEYDDDDGKHDETGCGDELDDGGVLTSSLRPAGAPEGGGELEELQLFELRLQLLDRDAQIRTLTDRLARQQELAAQLQASLMQTPLSGTPLASCDAEAGAGGCVPLLVAARRGDADILRAMLDGDGARPPKDVLDAALLAACQHCHVGAAELLLDRGADVHADLDSALLWACRGDDRGLVRLLLRRGADPNSLRGCALRLATHMGHLDVVRELVAHGAHAFPGAARPRNLDASA